MGYIVDITMPVCWIAGIIENSCLPILEGLLGKAVVREHT
jgi:hypothetical protein